MRFLFQKFPAMFIFFMATSSSAGAVLVCQPQINYTGSTNNIIVPAAVTQLRATAQGADGGATTGSANRGGSGAQVQAFFTVSPGDIITTIVGEAGSTGDLDAGGGGGSGVFINSIATNNGLALLAGAGGGSDNTGNGHGGRATNPGSAGNGTTGGAGGASGNGGGFGIDSGQGAGNGPAGGGGFLTAGGTNPVAGPEPTSNSGGGGGACINAGNPVLAVGGIAGGDDGAGAGGDRVGERGGAGCGAGGGSTHRESGGGGGYSGGGGGGASGRPGGGGSFVSSVAISPTITAGIDGGGSAANGFIEICFEVPEADLSITKNDSSLTYTPGDLGVYTIVVTNNGPDDVIAANIADDLPNGVTLSSSWSCAASSGSSCSAASGGSVGGNVVSLTADLLNGGSATVTVPVQFSTDMTDY